MIFLETKRLILRNILSEDIKVMHDYRTHERCAKFQRGQTKDLTGITQLVENHQHDIVSVDAPFLLAVAIKETKQMIGEIVVMPNDGAISLGYTFHYSHHRQGYAFEALSALVEMLHMRFPDWEFISFTDPDNKASMALLKKLGYEDMGYLPSKDSQVFGKWTTPETDAELTALTRTDCFSDHN